MSRQTAPDDGLALDATATDDPASLDDQGDGSEAEPTPANKPPRADDPALLQRAFTQSQQRWADLRKGLGLGKDATPDDILAAIEATKAQAVVDDDDDEAIEALAPAQVLELEARAEAAEWKYQAALYPETADAAREFTAFARQESDPETLTLKFYEILSRFSGDAPAPVEGAEADDDGDQGPEQIDVGIGDSPAADIQTDAAALERLRGSGKIAEGMRHIPGLARVLGNS